MIHLRPPRPQEENQATKASDEVARLALLDDLGVNPVDLLQSDSLLVVEGQTDERYLLLLLPVLLGRTVIYKAGNAESVEAVCRALNSGESVLPWICVRDRDLLTDEEMTHRMASLPGLFIWEGRSIEAEFLHPPLIAKCLEAAGRPKSIEEIESLLKGLAQDQRQTILAQLIEAELKATHSTDVGRDADPVAQLRSHLEATRDTAQAKLNDLGTVAARKAAELDERWERDSQVLADAKQMLGKLVSHTPFRSLSDLVNALAHTARDNPDLTPPGIALLAQNLEEIRTH
jgi:hypothetical protein